MLSVRSSFLAIRRLPSTTSSSLSSSSVRASAASFSLSPSSSPAAVVGGGLSRGTSRFFSTEPMGGEMNSNTDSESSATGNNDKKYITGSVKFYGRSRCYGFIIPDNIEDVPNNADEIWVHRTSFDTPYSADASPKRPYLYPGERVKFQLEMVEPNNTGDGVADVEHPTDSSTEERPKVSRPKAINLVFANGRQVPLFRKNYQSSVEKGESTRLGQIVLEIFDKAKEGGEESYNDETKLFRLVKDAVESAQESIRLAIEKQNSMVHHREKTDGQN